MICGFHEKGRIGLDYYVQSVLNVISFIEENLNEEISLNQVIEVSNFSKYHFLRIFKAVSGTTLNEYLRRRRLTKAAEELLHTDEGILDIAIRFSYSSQESFTRAFKDMYGETPYVYRQNGIHRIYLDKVLLTEKILNIKEGASSMVPKIVYKEGFTLVGMKYEGKNDNNEIPMLLHKFFLRLKEIKHRVNHKVSYGYNTWTDKIIETGEFTYIAGVEVEDESDLPEGMVYIKVPRNKYALFSINSLIEDIGKSISDIYSKWLPMTGLELADNYDFEFLNAEFIPNDENSELYFYVPIK